MWGNRSDKNRTCNLTKLARFIQLAYTSIFNLKPTSYLIATSSIGSWMLFTQYPYITFAGMFLHGCYRGTIERDPNSLVCICRFSNSAQTPVRAWYRFDGYLQIRSDIIIVSPMCHSIIVNPNPFIMPNRLTGAPYLALRSFTRLWPAFMLLSFISRTFPNSLFFHPRQTFHVGYAVSLACLSHEQC